MKFNLGCELNYTVVAPTTLLFNVEAHQGPRQQVHSAHLEVTPFVPTHMFRAPETSNIYRRALLQPGTYTIAYSAEVSLSPKVEDPAGVREMPVAELPLEVLPYLYPSRFCQSDLLGRFVRRQFGAVAPGHTRVTGICNWIYENVDYLAGSSQGSTSAFDTFTTRAGICRDFAHLGITFCRAMGVPARFVSAYGWQLTPQDFHAVFEAYLEGKWYLFDATRLCPVDGIARIGIGRDAADTAFATYYGAIEDAPKRVWVEPVDGSDSGLAWTTRAVSVSDI